MKKFAALVVFLALFTFAGCRDKAALDAQGVPHTLIIGEIQADNVKELQHVREQIRQFLSKKLGMPVEIVYTNDYVGLIEALRAKKIHAAVLPPFAYVVATRSISLTPIVTLGSNGKPVTYQSVLIANGHSNIKTIADMKIHAKALTLCFVDPASASGHLIPRAYLNTIGLNPDSAFKQTTFAGSHLSSVLAVKSGKIDIGCTTSMVFGLMERAKMLNPGDVNVLWTSAPIVSDPVAVRADLNKDFVKKLQQSYIAMNTEAPGILKSYVKIFIKDTVKRGFMPAADSLYNGLRKIAGGIKDLKAN